MVVEASHRLLCGGGVPMAHARHVDRVLAFIPNIGAIVSGVLMVAVGFSAGSDAGLWAIATYLIVQSVDGYIIVPYVARRTVDLAPALVLGAQLIFGALFGILGLLLADPIVAAVRLRRELSKQRARTRLKPGCPVEALAGTPSGRAVGNRRGASAPLRGHLLDLDVEDHSLFGDLALAAQPAPYPAPPGCDRCSGRSFAHF